MPMQKLKGETNMAQVNFTKTSSGLVPLNPADKEIYDKWKLGGVLSADFKETRNPKFHRKFFALLNLAFDYYEPSSGVLTADEKRIATQIFMSLDNASNNSGVMLDWGREFMKAESELRKSQIASIEKVFEPFRKDMIIQAGYYNYIKVPSGFSKEAVSISFAKMEQNEFSLLYRSVFDACWNFVLSRVFSTEEDAQEAATRMLTYV